MNSYVWRFLQKIQYLSIQEDAHLSIWNVYERSGIWHVRFLNRNQKLEIPVIDKPGRIEPSPPQKKTP